MAKETKTVTLRLPEELAIWVSNEGDGFNATVIELLETMRHLRAYSTKELKGVFTPSEWKLIADCLNGELTLGALRCNAGALSLHCKDAIEFGSLDTKWSVDTSEMLAKINKLTGAQTEAVYKRVEQLKDGINLNMWSIL